MTDMLTVKEIADLGTAAATGAVLLDHEKPGWWKEVDVNTLDLGNPAYCVLGQLYGDTTYGYPDYDGYEVGIAELFGDVYVNDTEFDSTHPVVPNGFDLAIVASNSLTSHYAALTEAWKFQILSRAAAA